MGIWQGLRFCFPEHASDLAKHHVLGSRGFFRAENVIEVKNLFFYPSSFVFNLLLSEEAKTEEFTNLKYKKHTNINSRG